MLYIFIILFLIYLYLIKPNNTSRKSMMKSFEDVLLTHRGFYNNVDIPENSLSAFKKTVEYNLGTELDVQLTCDNKLVVFHDANLKRMTGIDKLLTDCTYEELQQYNLLDTNEKIPLFKDVLDILKEDTPLIIEIKPEGDCIKTCEETVKLMKNYKRNFTMESFNPMVVKYLKDNYPEIIRGQLAENLFVYNNVSLLEKIVCTNLLLNFLTKPDYVAYDIKANKNLSFLICSKIYKTECVAWTIKNEKNLSDSKKYYQQFIFDSFVPKDLH